MITFNDESHSHMYVFQASFEKTGALIESALAVRVFTV
jgi:hypothetical protein